jgi:sugar phosphate isomerase/epimerase
MPFSRRDFLATLAAGVPALAGYGAEPDRDTPKTRTPLGIVLWSYSIRNQVDRSGGFRDPLSFLEFCHARGAGGVQVPIPAADPAYAMKLRRRAEALGMYLEGSMRLPRDKTDLDRFEAEVRTAREAGAVVLRTVLLSGRRYETFTSTEEFRQFRERSRASLMLAEPVAARHKVCLAVENHKDLRADELADLMKRLASDALGVCVDTGNNLALLENAVETVTALAPWARSVHLKDMGVEEYDDGFLLAEVPLGEGFLDLKRIVGMLKARPGIRFNLEMITRDPLKVPCLTERYWATFEQVPGRTLARMLSLVRQQRPSRRLPHVSGKSEAERLAFEDANVRHCLDYAAKHLPL